MFQRRFHGRRRCQIVRSLIKQRRRRRQRERQKTNSNLFPEDARITKAWDSRDELREMRVRRREGEGLDQDKRKNRGGGRVKQTNPKAKRV